ncbi:SUMF1/EgtB/PvdO family nonheme iron enzyme (plasmid) [Croceibacterium sp. TMG7-5b_MA50]|uniref:SUMF1/EgtB/PvdO family nonheme iron enzyme n=1 Tax=Croceibacterium sp. TMG7-5b_MA50 TaxID=3121290 RepID=UPI003221818A
MIRLLLAGVAGCALAVPFAAVAEPAMNPEMMEIPAGTFTMGAADDLGRDWFNERPAHEVTITRPFRIALHEVTVGEWRRFNGDTPLTTDHMPYAAGISWDDAVAYAAWLSEKTGRQYRLPTEAEWEHVARLAAADPARYAALEGLKSGPTEWTADIFGPYSMVAQIDPTGAASGPLRVVRGGRMALNPTRATHDPDVEIDYSRPEARLAFPPGFAPAKGAEEAGGFHAIGLRLVEGPAPATAPAPVTPPMHAAGVRQDLATAAQGPDPSVPYFRRRPYLPSPPDHTGGATIDKSGWDAWLRNHHHSPSISVLPNGDVLIGIYTSYREYEAGTQLIGTRLRHGADQWDAPAPLIDIVGVNDHAPLLMRDGGTVRLFWGNPYSGGAEWGRGGLPFQSMTTDDNGGTWSPIRYAHVTGPVGAHNRQPINTAFRDSQGRLLIASDGASELYEAERTDNTSLLWASTDDGETWTDTGGRTFGRHTTFVETTDGRILGFGGKNTNIDGFMPLSTSTDGGASYTRSKLPFVALSSGQRPSVLRLQSGRLMLIGDYVTTKPINRPVEERGSYIAISEDEGATWRFKAIPGTGRSAKPGRADDMEGGTLGYSAAAQGPDGVIHVVTSVTNPSVALAFNEAWIDAPDDAPLPDNAALEANDVTAVTGVTVHEERYPDGALRGRWSGGRANTGALVFDGPQSWLYPDGRPQWDVTYRLGRKVGTEKFYDIDGRVAWQREHQGDGSNVWTRWWPNGQVRSISAWQDTRAHGRARTWAADGTLLNDVEFVNGFLPGHEFKQGHVPLENVQ